MYEFQIIVYSKRRILDAESAAIAMTMIRFMSLWLSPSTVTELISHCEQTEIVLIVRLRTAPKNHVHVFRDP